jgi:ABC-type polysaccharide/polyol phosphate export permease
VSTVQLTQRSSNLSLALLDLREGLALVHVWPMLAWQEIKQRYRRSKLGPFWLTISTGAMIAGMGPLYGKLFGQDITSYVAHLGVSLVTWLFLSNLINESCLSFIAAESYIKQIKLPLSLHVLRTVWRNVIVFAHNLPILLVVYLFAPPSSLGYLLLAPLGLVLIAVNGLWLGLFLGMLCARFRDIPPIVASVVQIVFFLTPVMWQVEMLGGYRWLADLNPLFHFLQVVREPLLGRSPALLHWAATLAVTVLGWALTLALFSRFRARVAYWV